MTAAQVLAHVRALGREELGVEPTDAEVAIGCAAMAAALIVAPGFDPHEPIEDLAAFYREIYGLRIAKP